MHLTQESLIVILVVGLVAGWLAGMIVAGGGLGLIGDLVVGIVGAFIGNWMAVHFKYQIGHGIPGLIINATIGAIVLLILLRLIGGFGGGYGYRRW